MLTQSILCLAAQELVSVQSRYAKRGITVSHAALCGAKKFIEWQHYPSNDLIDSESGYEVYYHAHSASESMAIFTYLNVVPFSQIIFFT